MKKTAIVLVLLLAVESVAALALLPDSDAASTTPSNAIHEVSRGELLVTVTEQGTLESSNNTEIKCRVRGDSVITSVIESGTIPKPVSTGTCA